MNISDGITLPDGEIIKEVDLRTGYKYLGILEADGIRDKTMKCNITNEYYRRIQKILKSQLNGLNCITAINARAVTVVRYSAGIPKGIKGEPQNMDRKTRMLLTSTGHFTLKMM